MEKNKFPYLEVLATLIIIGTITYLAIKNYQKGKKIDSLEKENLEFYKKFLVDRNKIPDDIEKQLNNLAERYRDKFPKIYKELKTALKVYSNGENEKSIGSISICIENLLEMKYKSNQRFRNWIKTVKEKNHKNATQEDLIEFAHEEEILDDKEFGFATHIRKVINKTFHEAGYKLKERFGKAYLYIGIEITMKLAKSLAA
jgi:hypothetical protein